MKKNIKTVDLLILIFFLTVSTALANWQETFLTDYTDKGLNIAVINALAEGIAPKDIIIRAMAIENMDGKELTAAVCDAGVAVQEMQESLPVLGINQETAIAICEEISAANRFPGSQYSSASKRTNYDGTETAVIPPTPVPPTPPAPPRPASGNTF